MAKPVFGGWPLPFPPASPAPTYAIIDSAGNIFVQSGDWITTVDHPATGVYIINLAPGFGSGQNVVIVSQQFLSQMCIGAQFPTSFTLEVDTFDAAGNPANRGFNVQLLQPAPP